MRRWCALMNPALAFTNTYEICSLNHCATLIPQVEHIEPVWKSVNK